MEVPTQPSTKGKTMTFADIRNHAITARQATQDPALQSLMLAIQELAAMLERENLDIKHQLQHLAREIQDLKR
jgi:hypothetical protein